jgi:hypothetical protein
MAYENNTETFSIPAAADLSTHQYKLVTVNSSGQVALANATALVCGVLQNKPTAAGQAATVAYGGVSKCLAAGVITAGARVTADANGLAIAAATAGDAVIGIALATAAANDIIPVLVNPYPFAALA